MTHVTETTTVTESTETEIPVRGPQKFTIPRSYLVSLETIIDRANRRLARAGAEARFSFTHTIRMKGVEGSPGVFTEVADVTLNTPTISVGGYSFLAAIVKEENGFVVRTATGVELDGWRPDAMMCDHCGQRRRRNKTYLLATPEGELMQVGSSCLQPLLGMNPAGLWALIYDIEIPSQDDERSGGGTGNIDVRIPIKYVIAMGLGLSNMGENFITRSAVNNGYDGLCTADAVRGALFDTDPRARTEREMQAETAFRIMDTDNELIETIIAEAQNPDATTDYQMNMNILMADEWVKSRNIGYVVSAISMWNRKRKEAQESRKRIEESTPGYVDEVGAKIRNLEVTVTDIVDIPSTDYHGNPIYKSRVNLKDDAGHAIIWWASRVIDVKKGDKVLATSATVKAHKVFNGVDQTELTRVRIKANS